MQNSLTVLVSFKCCIYLYIPTTFKTIIYIYHHHVLISIDKIVDTCTNWYVYKQNFKFF